ncbi:sensor histidine kinase [Geomonas sp.]|uniref:sensor histidine kinase n=1 Tax=Geomonas sp. TaxID=2651584 RepID=UPI002B46F8EA|nr:ATP-binding protein [Geomonas sp.]HJV34391.1 ATP-binding protein [Geomonas sp.]
MHFVPLLLLLACELVLLWMDRNYPLSPWVHPAVVVALAPVLLVISASLKKRRGSVLSGLRLEISGMQQEVAKAACRYKSLLEDAGNAIFVFNAETGALEEANGQGLELLGFDKEELSSMLGRDLLHPDEREKFRSFVYQLKRHGTVSSEPLQFQRKDGSIFLGEISGRLIDLVDEQVVHCIVRDVTLQVQTQREIRHRNRELSILNDILTGMKQGPGVGVPEETLVEIMELFGAGGGTVHLVGEAGKPPQLSVSRQVADSLAKQLASAFKAPVCCMGVSVVEEGPPGSLFDSAQAYGWRSITGVPLFVQGHLVGVMHLLHLSPHSYTEEDLRFLESVGKQLANVIEKNRLFAELNWKSAELLRSHHLLEKSSHNLSLSEIKLKKNLALVEQANLELNRLDRMKNQFLGMVSHEFNTPLTSIISGADYLLQDVESRPEHAAVLEMVKNGGLRLRELVADLLKLIKLEARGDQLAPSVVHLQQFLHAMTEQLKPQLDERRQSVKLTGLDALPFFDGDREYLERIFGELLLNAMKFSPEGSEIEVRGRVVDVNSLWERRERLEQFNADFLRRCGNRCYLEVEVRDPGIGIPMEEQQGIFEIFYEVGEIRHHSSGSSRTQGKGAGLGLAMVKGMVEAHGGMVWVESEGGSSFFVLLPLEQEISQPALF